MGNKEMLIEKICVARNQEIGIYGFVFYRGKYRNFLIRHHADSHRQTVSGNNVLWMTSSTSALQTMMSR
jgi:hypothetical protein